MFARQTNIVWVGFAVACKAIDQHEGKSHFQTLVRLAKDWKAIVTEYCGHLVLAVCFAAFVVLNQGIVVGDRDNHVPVLHTSQMLHLWLVLALYLPMSMKTVRSTARAFSAGATLILVSVIVMSLELGWFEHPFLLADNRHYTFYLWKYLFRPYRLHLLPAYLLSILYVSSAHSDALKYCVWVLCSAASLVPAHLVEPRYFIQPLCMYLLVFPGQTPSRTRVWVLLLLDLLLVCIFALKPYKDIHFMW